MKISDNSAKSGPATILAGDIGGTHSRLAIYRHRGSGVELVRQETYASPDHGGLTDVLVNFFKQEVDHIDAACLGLPAPIHCGSVLPLTNLRWSVDRNQILRALGTDRVALINDVEASAAGIQGLSEADLVCLQPGHADPDGSRVVISVGTGLGVSALTSSGQILATEAGHATFSPRCDFDFELFSKLHQAYGHVSWERVASGLAIPSIHALVAPGQHLDTAEIVRRSGSDQACMQTVQMFRRYIGAAAGNVALTLMATGGLYVVGGVAEKVLDKENAEQFIEGFREKGRMRGLLERMPVFLVKERDLALRGAAQTAITRFSR